MAVSKHVTAIDSSECHIQTKKISENVSTRLSTLHYERKAASACMTSCGVVLLRLVGRPLDASCICLRKEGRQRLHDQLWVVLLRLVAGRLDAARSDYALVAVRHGLPLRHLHADGQKGSCYAPTGIF